LISVNNVVFGSLRLDRGSNVVNVKVFIHLYFRDISSVLNLLQLAVNNDLRGCGHCWSVLLRGTSSLCCSQLFSLSFLLSLDKETLIFLGFSLDNFFLFLLFFGCSRLFLSIVFLSVVIGEA